VNKVYLPLAGRCVLSWSFLSARQVAPIGHFVVVVRPEDADLARGLLARDVPGLRIEVVHGGRSRHESEQAALDHLRPRIDAGLVTVVAVHDGARPLAGPPLWRTAVDTAAAVGGAVPALPVSGLLPWPDRRTPPGLPAPGLPAPGLRALGLRRVQTPQAFRARELLDAYTAASTAGFEGTDTASSVEAFSTLTVRAVPGSPLNLKITYPRDVELAERLARAHRRP
jgi:2-C-methyl-D-erythritol 4-phosphate cytidylyltransferase